MKHIRFFGTEASIDTFAPSLWLRFLNWIRYSLERWIALRLLVSECKRVKASDDAVKEILRRAKTESDFTVDLAGRGQPTEPKRIRESFRSRFSKMADQVSNDPVEKAPQRQAPYERPIPLPEGLKKTFAAEARKADRSARYVPGRRQRQVIVDIDEEDTK